MLQNLRYLFFVSFNIFLKFPILRDTRRSTSDFNNVTPSLRTAFHIAPVWCEKKFLTFFHVMKYSSYSGFCLWKFGRRKERKMKLIHLFLYYFNSFWPRRYHVLSFEAMRRKGKGKGRLWVLQHCCLTRMSSFIHLQRRCTHQAAWETSVSEWRNYTWNLASNP